MRWRWQPRRAGTRTRVQVPFDTSASHLARHQMTGDLVKAGVPLEVIESAELVLGELVANAVRHGRPLGSGTIEVEWRVQRDELTVSVCDGGTAERLEAKEPSRDGFSGRGLAIVESLSDRWSVDRSHGVRVTAALGLTRAS